MSSDAPTEDPRPDRLRRPASLVVVNTGPGKGKTTAAIGIVIRSVARGWPVAVVQFVKGGSWRSGEEEVCRRLGVEWLVAGRGFTWESDDLDLDRRAAEHAWARARTLIDAGGHRLVVLDELTYPVNWGWLALDEIVGTIERRPDHVNVVVTGRDAPEGLIAIADTVTRMEQVRHAYEVGIAALRGIDY